MKIEEKREQVALQYKAVAHMAQALASVHSLPGEMFAGGGMDGILDIMGSRSAVLMEHLGDALNGMDAVEEADEWLGPVFAAAHELFPVATKRHEAGIPATNSHASEEKNQQDAK